MGQAIVQFPAENCSIFNANQHQEAGFSAIKMAYNSAGGPLTFLYVL
jgi:hypothetical protein